VILQNFPRIANNGKVAAEVWKQSISGGKSQVGLKFTTNIQSGFPAVFDTVAASNMNDIANADVAVGIGTVHVVWQDDYTGLVKYRKGTFVSSAVNEGATNKISVYPNPVENEIRINIPLNQDFSVEIFNTIGERVISAPNQTKINTMELKSGLYFITVKQNGSLFNQKFVKL